MRKRNLFVLAGSILISGFLFAGSDSEKKASTETQTAPKECCYERPGYQGTCHVTPQDDETCESILKYLNTPGTIGKSYCGGNKLRGGWKTAACEEEQEENSNPEGNSKASGNTTGVTSR